MIIGVDIGNYSTKLSNGLTFPSKVSKIPGLLSKHGFIFNGREYFVGEGNYDTEYRKVKKESLKVLFSYVVSIVGPSKYVVGLPISQYRQDKDEMREILFTKAVEDILIYPEGVATTIGTDFSGVIIDIGGRTCDCCLVSDNNGQKKIDNPLSIPKGTLNLYSDFVKILNNRYSLDLKLEDAEGIIKNGLMIDGNNADCTMALEAFKSFVDELISMLNVEYSLRTKRVMLVGGGAQLLLNPLQKRIPGAALVTDPIMANCKGFKRAGEQLWQR